LQQTAITFIQLIQKMTDIIIIRGAPGSGKSQTAKCLAQFFLKGVRLEIDTIRQMIISVDWTNQQEHINMLQTSTKLVYEFLKLGFKPVIIIDTFSGDKINSYLDSLNLYDEKFSIKIFGLFTTECELKKRLEKRINGEFKDFQISKKLNNDILKWKHEKEYQIDTTELSPSQTSVNIYKRITFEDNNELM